MTWGPWSAWGSWGSPWDAYGAWDWDWDNGNDGWRKPKRAKLNDGSSGSDSGSSKAKVQEVTRKAVDLKPKIVAPPTRGTSSQFSSRTGEPAGSPDSAAKTAGERSGGTDGAAGETAKDGSATAPGQASDGADGSCNGTKATEQERSIQPLALRENPDLLPPSRSPSRKRPLSPTPGPSDQLADLLFPKEQDNKPLFVPPCQASSSPEAVSLPPESAPAQPPPVAVCLTPASRSSQPPPVAESLTPASAPAETSPVAVCLTPASGSSQPSPVAVRLTPAPAPTHQPDPATDDVACQAPSLPVAVRLTPAPTRAQQPATAAGGESRQEPSPPVTVRLTPAPTQKPPPSAAVRLTPASSTHPSLAEGPPPPRGLHMNTVSDDLIQAALEELRPRLDDYAATRSGRRVPHTASDMLDAHWAFLDAEAKAPWRCDVPIEALPATESLLKAAMNALPVPPAEAWGAGADDSCEQPGEDLLRRRFLNVIVRRYQPGHRLKWHKDAIGLFEEPIYGAVLDVTRQGSSTASGRGPNPSRAFHPAEDGSGNLEFKFGRDRFVVPEFPGLVYVQTGPARLEWAHGVPTAGGGGRITVTWRWFRRSHSRWNAPAAGVLGPGGYAPLPRKVRDRWLGNFCSAASAAGVRSDLADGFLLQMDEHRDNAVPWVFRSKNEACGPQLTAAQLRRFRRRWHKLWRSAEQREDGAVPPLGDDGDLPAQVSDRCWAHAEQARRSDESMKQSSKFTGPGLDARVLPLLHLWEAAAPVASEISLHEWEDDEEKDEGEELDAESLADLEAMRSMGLPVSFAGNIQAPPRHPPQQAATWQHTQTSDVLPCRRTWQEAFGQDAPRSAEQWHCSRSGQEAQPQQQWHYSSSGQEAQPQQWQYPGQGTPGCAEQWRYSSPGPPGQWHDTPGSGERWQNSGGSAAGWNGDESWGSGGSGTRCGGHDSWNSWGPADYHDGRATKMARWS